MDENRAATEAADPDAWKKGPYDATANGSDAYGHPLNASGRCEEMNAEPPTCPPAEA